MSAILKSAIMDSDTAILESDTYLVIFSQIHSITLLLHSDSDWKEFNLINLMMVAILKCAILDSAIVHLVIFSQIHSKTLSQNSDSN